MHEWRVGSLEGGAPAVEKILSEPAEIWASPYKPSEKKLVIAERPIDALSYAQSKGVRDACYLALGGPLTLTPTRGPSTRTFSPDLARDVIEVAAYLLRLLAFERSKPTDDQFRRAAAEAR